MSLSENRKKTPKAQLVAEYRERQERLKKEAREALRSSVCPHCGSPVVFSHQDKSIKCSRVGLPADAAAPYCEYRSSTV